MSDNGLALFKQGLYGGTLDPIAVNKMVSVLNSAIQKRNLALNSSPSRSRLRRNNQVDPRRDLDYECGYPHTEQMVFQDYKNLYDREPIATRVVNFLPAECWKNQPNIYEDEDVEKLTDFEDAWQNIGNNLLKTNWYRTEKSNPIWAWLKRLDCQQRIGHYGILLFGFDDVENETDLSEPVAGINPKTGEYERVGREVKLNYLRVYHEGLAQISAYETDTQSPRYGQPISYNITNHDATSTNLPGGTLPNRTYNVHWTRVLHIAENPESNEFISIPAMRPVFNRVADLYKIYGGGAEGYWRACSPYINLATQESLGGDVEVDTSALKTQLDDMLNGMQRYLMTSGMNASLLSPSIPDPASHIDAHIEAICILLGVPKRIFMGSERGELASSQDMGYWNDTVRQRQHDFVIPQIIVPFINRLIAVGVLPEPTEYKVYWGDVNVMSDQERATVASSFTDCLAKYVEGQLWNIIEPIDYLVRFLGIEEGEAITMLENTLQSLESKDSFASKLADKATPEPPTPPSSPGIEQEEKPKPGEPNPADEEEEEQPTGNTFHTNAGANCGTGSGGFKAGNKCAKGGTGGEEKLAKLEAKADKAWVAAQEAQTASDEAGELYEATGKAKDYKNWESKYALADKTYVAWQKADEAHLYAVANHYTDKADKLEAKYKKNPTTKNWNEWQEAYELSESAYAAWESAGTEPEGGLTGTGGGDKPFLLPGHQWVGPTGKALSPLVDSDIVDGKYPYDSHGEKLQIYKQITGKLKGSAKEKWAVTSYKDTGHSEINASLWKYGKYTAEAKDMKKFLDKNTKKAPPPVALYRGAKLTSSQVAEWSAAAKAGGTVSWGGFMSMSLSFSTAKSLTFLQDQSGHKSMVKVYPKKVRPVGNNGELEFVDPPGSKYRVLGKTITNEIDIYHLEQL